MPVDIPTKKGDKLYETVAERLKRFRDAHPAKDGWVVITKIEVDDGKRIVVKAEIISPENRVIATGHAEEVRGSTKINRLSAMENAETSAVGRALFMAGYGNGEIATKDEIDSKKGHGDDGAPKLAEEVRTALEVLGMEPLADMQYAVQKGVLWAKPKGSNIHQRQFKAHGFEWTQGCWKKKIGSSTFHVDFSKISIGAAIR